MYIFFLLLLSNTAYAQMEGKAERAAEDVQFSCDRVKFNDGQNILELLGNVFFKTELIEVENAERIVYDKSKKEILVSGLKRFTMDGAIQLPDHKNTYVLRYTIGEKIAYLE